MEAGFGYNRLKIKDDTVKVFVPEDDIAKLMYYLDCVSTVLKYDGFYPYNDYKNYKYLTSEERKLVIELAILFNPKIMVDVGVFVETDNLDMNNRFFELTDETMNIHANEVIVIGGITTRVLKIMLFKSNWVFQNFIWPLKRLTQKETESYNYKKYNNNNNNYRNYNNNYTTNNTNYTPRKRKEPNSCCIMF